MTRNDIRKAVLELDALLERNRTEEELELEIDNRMARLAQKQQAKAARNLKTRRYSQFAP